MVGPQRVGRSWATNTLSASTQGKASGTTNHLCLALSAQDLDLPTQRLDLCFPQTVKNLPAVWETWFDARVRKIPWRRKCLPTPVFLPGEFHGQTDHGPWGRKWLTHAQIYQFDTWLDYHINKPDNCAKQWKAKWTQQEKVESVKWKII